ncbi:MAG: YHS domain-containing protein [Methanoregula sp.]|nr:YHS domain-containing protein [Methanoregula sp.]MDD5187951.1 YHS domain-containing protein [Methanoregula sp.]
MDGGHGMATDPVCFAIVDEDTARFRSTYNEREYLFCTNFCKKKFDENPKKYTRVVTDLTIDPSGASC